MVSISTQLGDVVLFYAEESLLGQIGEWIREHRELSLRLVLSRLATSISAALDGAAVVIIDATREPWKAMDVLQYALLRVERDRLAVYTERTHEGLEVFVRVRGVSLLLGPMSQVEWEGFFRLLEPSNTVHKHAPMCPVSKAAIGHRGKQMP